MLLEPLVHPMDITNSQQSAILRLFLDKDKRRHALKYAPLRQPVYPELEDIQLHLTILIASGFISDALSYIRRNQRNSVELMQHLLKGCEEMRKIRRLCSELLILPLKLITTWFNWRCWRIQTLPAALMTSMCLLKMTNDIVFDCVFFFFFCIGKFHDGRLIFDTDD